MAYYRIAFDSDEGIDSSIVSSISHSDDLLQSGIQKRHTLKRFKRLKDKFSPKSIEEVAKEFHNMISEASHEVETLYSQIRYQFENCIQDIKDIPDERFTPGSSSESRRDILARLFKERYSNNIEKDIKLRIFDHISKEILKDSKLELRSKVQNDETDFQDDVAKFELIEVKKRTKEIQKKLKKLTKRLENQLEEANKPLTNPDSQVVKLDTLKKYFVDKLWTDKHIIEEKNNRRIDLKLSKQRLSESIQALKDKVKSIKEKYDKYRNSQDLKKSTKLKTRINDLKREMQRVLADKREVKSEMLRLETNSKVIDFTSGEILELIEEALRIEGSAAMDVDKLVQEVEKGKQEFELVKQMYSEIERLEDKHDAIRGYPLNFSTVSMSIKALKRQITEAKTLEKLTDQQISRVQEIIDKRTMA
jgi:hypothetical protein